MYLVLLILGLLVSAAGFVTIGFGIPINAFSLGNTLIIAGTTAVAGGLVLIGLSMAVRQLRRIADALVTRPMPRPSRPGEPSADTFVPPAVRATPVPTRAATGKPADAGMAFPPIPTRPAAEPRPSNEPRASATASSADAPGPLDWLRPKNKTSAPAEPPMVEDEAPLSPLSPRGPGRLPLPSMPVTSSAPTIEPKVWSPSRGDASGEGRSSSSRPDQIARVAPASERAKDTETKDNGLFDVVWPDVKGSPSITGEPMKSERKADMPAPPREEPAAEKHPEPAPAPAGERPPSILKSGVIDGMAYTLYADGAIEAELPQGTVKFASVDALRAHLEKHG